MTDKENAAGIILAKLSNSNLRNDYRPRSAYNTENRTANFEDSNDSTVPLLHNDIGENKTEDPVPFSNRQIYKNLIILSVSFLLINTAYGSISILESSLNTKGNVGINALVVLHASGLFSFLFLANVIMDIFGLKWSFVIGAICYIFNIGANMLPVPILMYTAAAFQGVLAAPYWAAQANYIKRLAGYHASLTKKDVGHVVSLFLGIFYAIMNTNSIWGNVISYFVLRQTNAPQRFNCGIHFHPASETAAKTTTDISDTIRYVLCGILIGVAVLSLILLFALDQIRLAERQPLSQSLKKSLEVVPSIFRWQHIDQFLLLPITMWTMVSGAFVSAQFTLAFITCLVGIRYIGLIFTAGGICNVISSYAFGYLVKYIGRLGCFSIAAALNYGTILAMYFWEPRDDEVYVLYIIVCVFSIADAVWQTQVLAVYTVVYAKNDPNAIIKFNLWRAIGAVGTFAYASHVSIEMSLFILLAVLTVGMIGYGMVEIRLRWKNKIEKSKTSFDDC